MTEMNVSATVGMSATVGEMSATVGGNVCNSGGNVCNSGGNVCESGGNVCNSGEIEYGLRNLRVEIVIHNFDRLPIRMHGIMHVKIPLGFEKKSFRSESISWDMTINVCVTFSGWA